MHRRFLIVTPFLKGVTLALFLIHLFFVWSPMKKFRIDRVIIFDGVDDKQDEMWDFFNPVISGLEAQEEISTWFDGSFPSKELSRRWWW